VVGSEALEILRGCLVIVADIVIAQPLVRDTILPLYYLSIPRAFQIHSLHPSSGGSSIVILGDKCAPLTECCLPKESFKRRQDGRYY
jgi:hypothetical protein